MLLKNPWTDPPPGNGAVGPSFIFLPVSSVTLASFSDDDEEESDEEEEDVDDDELSDSEPLSEPDSELLSEDDEDEPDDEEEDEEEEEEEEEEEGDRRRFRFGELDRPPPRLPELSALFSDFFGAGARSKNEDTGSSGGASRLNGLFSP
eukprot:CAMPEP_0172617916 /NCGR_PEP_ID=MMETSP1068-20121228/74914_1 /TAXON_ID=35684 /ORGANISM="Pseudopedinella elastica, Strain CCMP716" /LENGTH=148 /DNA_ID=CAMNT_0013423879 /DNA_START=148 /DNA_END=593 /DNA_ORIENTATION=+